MAPTPELIKIQIDELLATRFEIPSEKLSNPQTQLSKLGMDSLDMLDFIVELEKTFDQKLDLEKVKEIKTLKDIQLLVEFSFGGSVRTPDKL